LVEKRRIAAVSVQAAPKLIWVCYLRLTWAVRSARNHTARSLVPSGSGGKFNIRASVPDNTLGASLRMFSNSILDAFKPAETKTWGNPEWVPQANFEERNAGLGINGNVEMPSVRGDNRRHSGAPAQCAGKRRRCSHRTQSDFGQYFSADTQASHKPSLQCSITDMPVARGSHDDAGDSRPNAH
jgi:hypothetical protein